MSGQGVFALILFFGCLFVVFFVPTVEEGCVNGGGVVVYTNGDDFNCVDQGLYDAIRQQNIQASQTN